MTIEILTSCPFCGEENIVEVPIEEFFNWQSGELAQNALKSLTASEREMLISGICTKCQKGIFGE